MIRGRHAEPVLDAMMLSKYHNAVAMFPYGMSTSTGVVARHQHNVLCRLIERPPVRLAELCWLGIPILEGDPNSDLPCHLIFIQMETVSRAAIVLIARFVIHAPLGQPLKDAGKQRSSWALAKKKETEKNPSLLFGVINEWLIGECLSIKREGGAPRCIAPSCLGSKRLEGSWQTLD